MISITRQNGKLNGSIKLPGSKSISNRVLIIRSLCKNKFAISNLSNSNDTTILEKLLNEESSNTIFDAGDAGTVMRFMTAYLALSLKSNVLTGSKRMKERPIKPLVDALIGLGAKIDYLEEKGYAPIQITGSSNLNYEISVDGSMSSQFITALLLISPVLPKGLKIVLKGEISSTSYILMTLKMMRQFNVESFWEGNIIIIPHQDYIWNSVNPYFVESDWSSASYWYSFSALSEDIDILLEGLNEKSLQGDQIISNIYTFFGVKTEFVKSGVRLFKSGSVVKYFGFDFSNNPDIAQTLAITCTALQIPFLLNGLATLRYKECDRFNAIINELLKFGVHSLNYDNNTIEVRNYSSLFQTQVNNVDTYGDHRMAMSFAGLCYLFGTIRINEPEVVAKSYPNFWNDMISVGFNIS